MTVSLHEHIHRCNVYLREALPKARQEQAAGRLELDKFVTDCGTMGCVAFHYADAMGVLDELKSSGPSLSVEIHFWANKMTFEGTFIDTGAFDASDVSLDERESLVRARLAEYEAQL